MKHLNASIRWRVALSLLTTSFVLGFCLLYFFRAGIIIYAAKANPTMPSIVFKGHRYSMALSGALPPTDQQCRQQAGIPCYSPQEMRKAYGIDALLNKGYDGEGQSIVIIDSFGSPTIQQDLHTFDTGYSLPDPPSFKIYAPLGTTSFDPTDSTMASWAAETTVDVEWAHAMAPGANIVLMTSPVAETQDGQGMQQFLQLEQYALDNHLGQIISQSWGATENALSTTPNGQRLLTDFNNFYKDAAADGITVFASSGDSGVANPDAQGNTYPSRTVNFPASSPYVTAVGGTSLTVDTNGNYQSEVAWNSSGGGVSQYFKELDYQQNNLNPSDQALLNGYRGLPDVAYDADPGTPILIYLSFLGAKNAGYYFIGGTSEGSPQWAGLVAGANQLASQLSGHTLGFLNPSLYKIGNSSNYQASYHDITACNNSVDGIKGYTCTPGWDPVTGWGSPDATALLMEIIQMEQQG